MSLSISMRFSLVGFAASIIFGFTVALPAQAGWIDQSSGTTTDFEDVSMLSATSGFAVGTGLILTTGNGTNWSAVRHPVSITTPFYDVAAIGATGGNRVYVVGRNIIMYAPDGSDFDNVSPAGLSLDADALLYGVDTPTISASGNGSTAFIVGKKGDGAIVLRTTTSGASWTDLTSELPPGTPGLWDIDCVSVLVCYAVGENATIVKTTNGGSDWTTLASGIFALRAVTAIDATHAWASGAFGLIRVTSNGTSWTSQTSSVTGTTNLLRGIDFVDLTHGMAVGNVATTTQTADGSTWTSGVVAGAGTLTDVDMLNSNTGWAVGTGGKIYRFDGTGPIVSAVTPITATSGTATTFSATYSDNFGVTVCRLYSSSVLLGTMTLSTPGAMSGTASLAHTFADPGTVSLQVRCDDTAGNTSSGALTTVTVAQGNRPPGSPTMLAQRDSADGSDQPAGFTGTDTLTFFRGVVTDPDGDTVRIDLEIDPVGTAFSNLVSDADPVYFPSGGIATINRGRVAGSYHWQARTTDSRGASSAWVAFGGNAETAADFITVTPPANNPPVAPSSLSQHDDAAGPAQVAGFVSTDGSITFRGMVSDTDGDSVRLHVEFQPVGTPFTGTASGSSVFVVSGSLATTITFSGLADASYHWQARTMDDNGATSAWVPFGGNAETAADFTVTRPVANNSPNPPSGLSQHDSMTATDVTPAWAVGITDDDAAVIFRATASDPDAGQLVRLEVEARLLGTAFSGVANVTGLLGAQGVQRLNSLSVGLADGSYHWQMRVLDAAGAASAWVVFGGNAESAADFIIMTAVAAPGAQPGGEPSGGATGGEPITPAGLLPAGFAVGDLVKLADDGNPNTFGDSAVFYLGANGGRYVFTNDKAYFTWYADFSPIRAISTTDLAAIPLRGNITYRPGVKMIKLQTNPTVYVVTAGGVLRAVPSEAIASSLYGANWNQEIDDINDAFWTNYTVGTPLVAANDFNRTVVRDAATTINIDRGLVVEGGAL